jgi:hypothetical protein
LVEALSWKVGGSIPDGVIGFFSVKVKVKISLLQAMEAHRVMRGQG